MNNARKNFDILAFDILAVRKLLIIFDNSIKLFSDLYLIKFSDTSVKLYFSSTFSNYFTMWFTILDHSRFYLMFL